jgi:hypothetical protein
MGRGDGSDYRVSGLNKYTKLRKRRSEKAKLKFGSAAISKHSSKSGRTGMVQAKRTPSKHFKYSITKPNVDNPTNKLG